MLVSDLLLDVRKLRQIGVVGHSVRALLNFNNYDIFAIMTYLMNHDIRIDSVPC